MSVFINPLVLGDSEDQVMSLSTNNSQEAVMDTINNKSTMGVSTGTSIYQKENRMIAATITEDGEYINSRFMSRDTDLVFTDPRALIWAFEEITRKAAEVELAIEEKKSNQLVELARIKKEVEFNRMIRAWRAKETDVFTGPSLGTDKKLRTMYRIMWRKQVKEYEAKVRAEREAIAAQVKAENRAFTQYHQEVAKEEVMTKAKARKEERQAKHQARIAKMKAKKVNGVTPKQPVTKKTSRPKVTKKVVKQVIHACTATTNAGTRCTRIATYGGECTQHHNVRINNQKENIKMRNLKKAIRKLLNSKDWMIDTKNREQGARMRMLVSALMTNKEVK